MTTIPSPSTADCRPPAAAVCDRRGPQKSVTRSVGGHKPPLRVFLALAFLFLAIPATIAQRATLADGLKAAVLRADEVRLYAMLAPDLAALDDVLTADCLYVHSNGTAQTKAEFLTALRTGAMKYTSIRYVAPPQVRLYGAETAVLTGTMQLEVALPDGREMKLTILATALYVVKNDRWQLASYQSTPAPAK